MSSEDLSGFSLQELFRLETETQAEILTKGLLALERHPGAVVELEACMRAAHSLKGAARVVGLDGAVAIAHALEDCLAQAQGGQKLHKQQVDLLLRGVDLLTRVATANETELLKWSKSAPEILDLTARLAALADGPQESHDPLPSARSPTAAVEGARGVGQERYLRVTARNFNRLLAMSGECVIESRWLEPFSQSLQQLRRQQCEALEALDLVRDALQGLPAEARLGNVLAGAREKTLRCQQTLSERAVALEHFERRHQSLARRLHDEALRCRMRPFSDGVHAFERMVRDLTQALGKRARLTIVGEHTQVDRDVLEKLEAPLVHLLRNAVDHGLESPELRVALGKPAEAQIRLEARHVGGMLQVSVSDDGQGVDKERVRVALVRRGLLDQAAASHLSDSELFDFLLLPGFTLKDTVTEISGRGVGLDVVQDSVRELRGSLRIHSQAGQGATFQLVLPLAVSLIRTLLVEIGSEPYAFPLAHVDRTLCVPKSAIQLLEGRQHIVDKGRPIGLVAAHQLFGRSAARPYADELAVVVLSHREQSYGLVVEKLLGTRELVLQPLEARFGKIRDIAAGALLEDGSPVLVVDVMDLLVSVEKLSAQGGLETLKQRLVADPSTRRKRVLVVDDSLTVRELERKIVAAGGYDVEVAVDGLDAWNTVRTGEFSLVVTDVDMPRLDGIELTRLIRQDPRLRTLPVMIVSYKDRKEDHRRGLDAGADFYLAKSSFHSDNLLQAVVDLIGEP